MREKTTIVKITELVKESERQINREKEADKGGEREREKEADKVGERETKIKRRRERKKKW